MTVIAQGSPAVFRAILRSGFIVVTHDVLRDTGFPVPATAAAGSSMCGTGSA